MDEKIDNVVNDLPDPDLKIILLGDSAVGKSKLIERYLMNDYNPRQVLQTFTDSWTTFYRFIVINLLFLQHI